MKRLTAVILAILLLLSMVEAQASTHTLDGMVTRYAYFTDTYETGESNSTQPDWPPITMEVGDYLIVTPVHWIRTSHVSYALGEITVSDPDVLGASFDNPSDGHLGIRLYAKKAGSAEVTATWRTYLSKQGLSYTDERSKDTFSQKLTVQVEEKGTVDLKLNISGGSHKTLKGALLRLQKLFDTKSVAEREKIRGKIQEATQDYWERVSPPSAARRYTFDESASELEDVLVDYMEAQGIAGEYKYTPSPFATTLRGLKLGRNMIGGMDEVWTHTSRIRNAYLYAKYQTIYVPTYYPETLTLQVTVENNTKHPIDNLAVKAQGDEHLSFYGITGAKGTEQKVIEGISLRPGEKRTFPVPIYPSFVYGTLAEQADEPMYVYTTNLQVSCSYTLEEQESSVAKTISLPMYTSIDQTALKDFKSALWREYKAERVSEFTSAMLGGAFNGYKRWYGFERFAQVFTVACPVDVSVYTAEGEWLVTLSGEEMLYTDGTMIAESDGETKYVIIPDAQVDQYAIRAQATAEGTMDVLTYAYKGNGGFSMKWFEQVKLQGQDQFSLVPELENAAGVNQINAETGSQPLQPSAEIRQEDLLAALAEDGYSEDAARIYIDLMARDLIPGSLSAGGDAPIQLETWSEMLLRMAGWTMGVDPDMGEVLGWTRAALASDLLSEELAAREATEEITYGEALRSLDDFLGKSGFVETGDLLEGVLVLTEEEEEGEDIPNSDESLETNEEKTHQWMETITWGEEHPETLTNADALILMDRVMAYAEAAVKGGNLLKTILEVYENNLTWYDDQREHGLYAMDGETEESFSLLLRNGGLWYPTIVRNGMLISDMGLVLEQQLTRTRNSPALKVLKGNREGVQLAFSSVLSGVFVDEENRIYPWNLLCETNDAGEMAEDAVYLQIARITEGANLAYMNQYGMDEHMDDNTMTYFLIADQELVLAVLEVWMNALPVGRIEAGTADALILDWYARHANDQSFSEGMTVLANRMGDARDKDLQAIIDGEKGASLPNAGVAEIPEELTALCGDFPENINMLRDAYSLSSLEAVADELWLNFGAIELFNTGSLQRSDWTGTVRDVTFYVLTMDGMRDIPIDVREPSGFVVLLAEEEIPMDEAYGMYLLMDYEYGDTVYHILADDQLWITSEIKTFEHPEYANVQLEISYAKGQYITPSYSLEITATDPEGATYSWYQSYDMDGNLYGDLQYSETVE